MIAIVAILFVVILFLIAVFIAQQMFNAESAVGKKQKSLSEKLAGSGIGALDTEKFRNIVMNSSEDGASSMVQPLVESDQRTYKSSGEAENDIYKLGETPDKQALDGAILSDEKSMSIESKDFNTIYNDYLAAKNLNPFDVEPDFTLGAAYLKFGYFEKAQKQFLKVIDTKADYPGAYYYLGEAYRCNGQFYEAMNAYKTSWEQGKKKGAEKQEPTVKEPQSPDDL